MFDESAEERFQRPCSTQETGIGIFAPAPTSTDTLRIKPTNVVRRVGVVRRQRLGEIRLMTPRDPRSGHAASPRTASPPRLVIAPFASAYPGFA